MTGLNIENLSVTLRGKHVLRSLNLQLPSGKLIGLIGPNGAGKSTFLRACLRLIPAEGKVTLYGKDLLAINTAQRARYLSFLPQERELAWALSVETVVRLGLPINPPFGVKDLRSEGERIDHAIRLLELETLRHRQASDLSGGELARVLIARLIIQDTPIILADEPLAGLDPQQQIKVMRLFQQLAASGKTIIASIHDLTQAALWCDELVLIDKGELKAQGRPPAVLTPHHLAETYRINADIRQDNGKLLITPMTTID